ncbi:MAG: hypothetical protein JWO17_1867 [Actinomycetia bacterium]|nr:hypothetical protein [Actinomycetes bacterium]
MDLKFRPTRKRALALATLAASMTAVGIAYGAIPDGNGVYSACMLKATGTIRLIDPALPSSNLLSHCTTWEKLVSWSSVAGGLPGKDGTNGKDGAPGPPGTNGTNGTDGAAGLPGKDGTNGVTGPAGPKGDKGDTGSPGSQGPAGSSTGGSLEALAGTPCGAAGGKRGVTKIEYQIDANSDAIALTCSHPADVKELDIWGRSTPFVVPPECMGAEAPCVIPYAVGQVTVSPADVNGKSGCSFHLPQALEAQGPRDELACTLQYDSGTTVTLTIAATAGTFVGWGIPPADAAFSGTCVTETANTCVVTVNANLAATAAFTSP